MTRRLTTLLAICIMAGLLVYAVGLFKNISYPLMWADESMTAVGAQRVLDFGYPKVHDGKNVFYDLRHSNLQLGIEPRTDAYIGGAGWLQYYFAAPLVALSQGTTDLYQKTAILRIPFAFAGFAGLLILLWVGTRFVGDPLGRLAIAMVFVLLLLPSVALLLHLREVRYYSLLLLLSSLSLGAFSLYHLQESGKFRAYGVALAVMIPLLFLAFAPAALAVSLAICLYLFGEWFFDRMVPGGGRHALKKQVKPLLPVFAGAILVLPLAWFFQTLHISRELADFYRFSSHVYLENLEVVWGYFARYDVLVFAVAAKLLLLILWRQKHRDPALLPALRFSLFLALYCVVYTLCIGKIPNRLFTRYFITLQPLLILSFAIDLALLVYVTRGLADRRRLIGAGSVALLLAGSLFWSYSRNMPFIKGRIFEITNQYKGVLDYVIPYLREHSEDPSKLVIATNYEETSYIYYLGSRVMVGFLNPDLKEDLRRGLPEQPDVVVFRRFWATTQTEEIFNFLLARDDYIPVRFPVYDYGFNNIPEVVHWTPETGWEWGLHYFSTVTTTDPDAQTVLFLRQGRFQSLYPRYNEDR